MRTYRYACFAIAALTVLFAAPANAQAQPESGPTLDVHLRTLKRSGGVSMTAHGNTMAVAGTPVTWFLSAGSSNPADMTVCGGGVGEVGTLADKLSRNAFVWEVRMSPTKLENGTTTFDLEWARYQADGAGRPAADGKTTLSLREGDWQQIDFVRGATGSRNCSDDAAIVEVGAGYKENADLASSILQYDVWLQDQQPNGETTRRHFTAMGSQGSDVNFVFAPLTFAVSLPVDQGAYDVVTAVHGTVKGRVLRNGRIALMVDTSRRDGLATRGSITGGGSGNAGRKVLEIALDEAIEIELPAPGGSSRVAARGAAATPNRTNPTPAPTQAVSIHDGRVIVNNALFFQAHRTSLIVQVKAAR